MYGVYVWAKHSYSPSAAEKKEGTRRSALFFYTFFVRPWICIRPFFLEGLWDVCRGKTRHVHTFRVSGWFFLNKLLAGETSFPVCVPTA